MRLSLACLATAFLVLAAAPPKAHAQSDQTQAVRGDTVWVVLNHIKPDKVEQFETFIYRYLQPALAEHKPEWLTNVRFLHPTEANEDGTYTYTFLMDPKVYPSYQMMLALEPMYGSEAAETYMSLFGESLKDGRQVSYVQVESRWQQQ